MAVEVVLLKLVVLVIRQALHQAKATMVVLAAEHMGAEAVAEQQA